MNTRHALLHEAGAGAAPLRPDLKLVADMIPAGVRVLDVGCGEGELLSYLTVEKQVDGRGMELSQAGVNACVAKGLSVIQGDADRDLADYPDDAFDYVILSQSLQQLRLPREALRQMLRIGRRAVVSFPNFGYWKVRLWLLLRGRMPITRSLPWTWYDTPNIHFCSIRDFVALCREMDAQIDRGIAADYAGRSSTKWRSLWLANVLGEQGVFLLRRVGAR